MNPTPYVSVSVQLPAGAAAPSPEDITAALAQLLPTAVVSVSMTTTTIAEPVK